MRVLPGKAWDAYNTTVKGANLTTTMKEGGYDITVNIPWDSLFAGFTPKAGTKIGFDILASDNDGDKRNQLTWNAKTQMPWNDASLFGTLELVDNGTFKSVLDSKSPEKAVATATVVGSTVTLEWDTPADDVAVMWYNVKQDGVVIKDSIYSLEKGNKFTVKDLADGTYKFTVVSVDNSGNSSTSAISTVEVKTVSINDMAANFKVYPNPSNGIVNIVTGKDDTSVVDVFSITGEKVMRKSFVNNCSIDLSNQHKGFYILNVATGNGVKATKLEVR